MTTATAIRLMLTSSSGAVTWAHGSVAYSSYMSIACRLRATAPMAKAMKSGTIANRLAKMKSRIQAPMRRPMPATCIA
jgi:hypothetical protein